MRWLDRMAGRGRFLRPLLVVVSGTAGGQLLTAAAMPVLSRLYSPADFGQLAVFAGVISTVAVAACLRWDIAIALPETEPDAFGLLILSVASSLIISILVLLAVTLYPTAIAASLGQPELAQWLWLVPIAIFSTATCSALHNWLVREKAFGTLAKVRLSQAGSASFFQISAGAIGAGVVGLLIGYIINTAVAVAFLGAKISRRCLTLSQSFNMTSLRRIAKDYRRFPAFSTVEALANVAAIHVPIILIASRVGNETAGQIMLAMYVIQAPMGLIGGAIAQVYLSQAPEEHRRGRLDCFTLDVLSNLAKVGIGPLVAIGLLSPVALGFVFGSQWNKAGYLISWMTPWFILQFLASPVSMTLHVTRNQRAAMTLQLFGLCLRVLTVLWASVALPNRAGEIYAVSGFFLYAGYLLFVASTLRISLRRFMTTIAKQLSWSFLWIISSVAIIWVHFR